VGDLTFDTNAFVTTLVTVLVIMDPIGNVPIFVSLTRFQDNQRRNRSALVATLVAGAVIFSFALAGEQLLNVLGISLEALQVAGGLLLLLIGYELLNPTGASGFTTADTDANVALVPLGTPLLAGPGAIAATMLAVAEADDLGGRISVWSALLVALLVVFLGMRFASVLGRLMRPTLIDLVSRVLGIIVAAIGVQLLAAAIEVWITEGVA
jgi:multiple antibiotic resistance protein